MFGWSVAVPDMGLSTDRLWVNMLLPESKEVMKESNRGLVWRVNNASINVQSINNEPAEQALKNEMSGSGLASRRDRNLCRFGQALDDDERDVIRSGCPLAEFCECGFDAVAN